MSESFQRDVKRGQRAEAEMPTFPDPDIAYETAARSAVSADTERLDWLEGHGCMDIALNKLGSRPEFFSLWQMDRELSRGSTLREAIDAARSLPSDTP